MIFELVLTIVAATGLLAAGWGLALLWQKDDPPYEPLPARAWELPAPGEFGGTYGMRAPIDLTLNNRHDDAAPVGVNNEQLDFYPDTLPEICVMKVSNSGY